MKIKKQRQDGNSSSAVRNENYKYIVVERKTGMRKQAPDRPAGLYRPEFEHDNCGIGAVVNIKGTKNHETVANA